MPPSRKAGSRVASFSTVELGTRAVVLADDSAVGESHRHDLTVKEAGLLSGDGEHLAALRVLVLLLTGDAVTLGDVLGGLPHRDVGVRLARLLALQCLVLILGADGLLSLVELRDELDPGGDVHVALTGGDRVGGGADRLEAGSAVAADGRRGGLVAKLLAQQHSDAADVVGLDALRQSASGDDLLDGGRVDARVALEQRVEDEGEGLIGPQARERTLEGSTDGSTDGVDDDCFWHG